jgi:RNA polymerase sigma factor (TIGR02999 family)
MARAARFLPCRASPPRRRTPAPAVDHGLAGAVGALGAAPGERSALDVAFSAAYEELRRLAGTVRRDAPDGTLSPTALVNEAWMKLAASPRVAAASPPHFRRIAARAMRQVLVEAARRRSARKRGGPGARFVALDESAEAAAACGEDVLALDAALDDLATTRPLQAAMIEVRFFGGLDVAETAAVLQVSEATILRDWRAARAWLTRALRQAR